MGKKTRLSTREVDRVMKSLADQAPEIREFAAAYGAEAAVSEGQFDAPVVTGALKAAHGQDSPRKGIRRLFVNLIYAAPVHARHPTKAGWFQQAILRSAGKGVQEGARIALERAAQNAKSGGKMGTPKLANDITPEEATARAAALRSENGGAS